MSKLPYIYMSRGIRTALRVHERLVDLWPNYAEDDDAPYDGVVVSAFSSSAVCGLHYDAIHAKRSANLTEERICDGIAINYGPQGEYDRITNMAIGRVTRIEYSEHQVDDVARDLIEWLLLGKEPEERETISKVFERTVFDSPDTTTLLDTSMMIDKALQRSEETTNVTVYRLISRKGVLPETSRKPKGRKVTQEQIERLGALTNLPFAEGNYIDLHRQRYTMILNGAEEPLDNSEIVLYNETTGSLYAVYVKKSDYKAYCHGVYYGFPKCCIEAFFTRNRSMKEGWWIGTGYIACKQCEDKPEAEIREGIASRRLAPKPFPIDDMDTPEHTVHFLEMFCAGKTNPRQYML